MALEPTPIESPIWVMGDMLGPYGRGRSLIKEWAWQTWPWTSRFLRRHEANTDQVVALIRKHVQCEIDLHQNACMLLHERGVIPPLVFRPWCDCDMQPCVVTLRSRNVDGPRVLIEQASIVLRFVEIAEVYV